MTPGNLYKPRGYPFGALVVGPELVINGSFTTDTGWTKGEGWTIAGGVAVAAPGATSELEQVISTLVAGDDYRLQFTLVTVNNGGVTIDVGDGTASIFRSNPGTYTQFLIAGATNEFNVNKGPAFDGTIDNISLRKVLNPPPVTATIVPVTP